jgi:hypothetical protein
VTQINSIKIAKGWAAVVANLEDTAMELQRRNDKFDGVFHTYLNQRDRHKELIEVFDDDMALLHQVTVSLPGADPTIRNLELQRQRCCGLERFSESKKIFFLFKMH